MSILFEYYPDLRNGLAHVGLGSFPTPVEPLKGLGHDRLYIKRDDLSGNLYGGNKVRKLEFLLAEAQKAGHCGVQTAGGVGSNHVVATSLYARHLGLRCLAVLVPQPKSSTVAQNLRWTLSADTEVLFCEDQTEFSIYQSKGTDYYRTTYGREPALILMGGSSPLGTVGFVAGAFELGQQIQQRECPKPDVVYVPFGTMGTAVGLILGFALQKLDIKVVPVRVVSHSIGQEQRFSALFTETNALLNKLDPSIPLLSQPKLPSIRHDYFGPGYGHYTPEGQAAICTVRETEGLHLEGTYTGKTVAALLGDIAAGKLQDKNVLYWFTYNSQPAPEDLMNVEVPENLRDYVTPPFQSLDRQ